jgi:cyclic beta-1,2-glucan synthetase
MLWPRPATIWLDVAHALHADGRPASSRMVSCGDGRARMCGDPSRDIAAGVTTSDGAGRSDIVHRMHALALRAEGLVDAMDFRFLFDESRKLLSIGYRLADATLDPSCYDLLASESRLASFVAIAKADVPPQHWFVLGRTAHPGRTRCRSRVVVGVDVRVPHADAGDAAAARQPARRDLRQRRAATDRLRGRTGRALGCLGVRAQHPRRRADLPVLRLRRPRSGAAPRAGADVVVAPYATALAAMVDPQAALANFRGSVRWVRWVLRLLRGRGLHADQRADR